MRLPLMVTVINYVYAASEHHLTLTCAASRIIVVADHTWWRRELVWLWRGLPASCMWGTNAVFTQHALQLYFLIWSRPWTLMVFVQSVECAKILIGINAALLLLENAEGNTPLHLAGDISYPDVPPLVELLFLCSWGWSARDAGFLSVARYRRWAGDAPNSRSRLRCRKLILLKSSIHALRYDFIICDCSTDDDPDADLDHDEWVAKKAREKALRDGIGEGEEVWNLIT